MNLNEYQKKAYEFALQPSKSLVYLVTGLGGEAGELQSIYAKWVRDGGRLDVTNVKKELGDILWFVSAIAEYCCIDLDDVAQANIDKLESRKQRGTIGGSGDER